MLTIVSLLIVLGVLVFVHELGHFLAAKWAGIYVHRFSLGLGSPIPWLTFRRGETEYSVSWLPLGGYVKMASREEDIEASPLEGGRAAVQVPFERTFEAKPVWQRMVVILAGVTMNALFAWGVYIFLAAKNGRQTDPVTTVGRVVEELVPPGAEALREVRPGARIVRVAGEPVSSWNEVVQQITATPARQVTIDLADGSSVVLDLHPDALEERVRVAQALLPYRAPVVGEVVDDTPAERAGLQPGDTIVAVAGRPVEQWYDLVELLQDRAGQAVPIEVTREGGRVPLTVHPYADTVPGPDGKPREVGRMGVALQLDLHTEPLTLGQAIVEGGRRTAEASTQILRTLRGLLSGRVSGRALGGPILIGQLAGESARLGIDPFLAFMALISINLAVLNLLPVPVLDGGQLVFLIAEAVIRRPLPLRLRERLTAVGLVLIILLMGLAFSNDIRRLLGG